MIHCVRHLLWFILACVSCLFYLCIEPCVQYICIFITDGHCILGCVLCDPNTYQPHKSPGPRDSAAQIDDMELQIAGPPIFLTSVNTPFGCKPRGLKFVPKYLNSSTLSKEI